MNSYRDNREKQFSRDLNILRYCAAGPTPFRDLHRLFFNNDEGHRLSRQVVSRRLSRLSHHGFTVILDYINLHGTRDKYIVLSHAGATLVSKHFNIARESIRTVRPPHHRLGHELVIASIIRIIDNEVSRNKYRVAFLFDDSTMRQLNKATKGSYFPDLSLRMLTTNGEIPISLEYDSGVKPESYWVSKISTFKGVALILCNHPSRLQILTRYIRYTMRFEPTGLAVLSDFIKLGVAETEWYWVMDNCKSTLL